MLRRFLQFQVFGRIQNMSLSSDSFVSYLLTKVTFLHIDRCMNIGRRLSTASKGVYSAPFHIEDNVR